MREGRRIEVRGTVQGVGFRPHVYRLAHALGVAGSVRNHAAGVTIVAYAPREQLDELLARVAKAPAPAVVEHIDWEAIADADASDFVIDGSAAGVERRVSIPADLAMCAECEREIHERNNRRFGYPFTNCTHCGPRFSIARDIPYDRPATTMAGFRMCAECQREYDDPEDRRFHAQPNACPLCGPRLRLLLPDGTPLPAPDAIALAAVALNEGRIVALKGLGGFHLACDATSERAVDRLRERKRRDAKPLAVMVRDLAAAEHLAELDDDARALLASAERPIVLLPRRVGAAVAEAVAGGPLVGLMLAYTPLHHLLTSACARPLVMTSGNFADEPIVFRDDEAVARLGPIADLILTHDRDIENRCDDSVARVVASAPMLLRRSRGYVPHGVALSRALARPVLACGGQLKNTFCLGVGDTAYLSPHIGDLDNLEVLQAFEQAVARLERFVRVRPEVVAHDLHPDFLSTRYARECSGVVRVAVQHHHAHIASVMAERGLDGPVLGVAYDGMGYGSDGAAWGGELLLSERHQFTRLATFRPVALAGGDRAVQQVWRIALALVEDAFDGDAPTAWLRLFAAVPPAELSAVRQLLARGVHAPPAHGVGRFFDGIGALVLRRTTARYEGEVASYWNLIADVAEHGRYPFDLDAASEPWRIDLRPMVRAVVADLVAGEEAAAISARFHTTLAEATRAVVRLAARQHGRLPVVLSGGCFQNALLAERVIAALPGFEVHLNRAVPPNDGGLALGQALVADAMIAKGVATCA